MDNLPFAYIPTALQLFRYREKEWPLRYKFFLYQLVTSHTCLLAPIDSAEQPRILVVELSS